jgi:D-alanyl-lipoteichoic acid acyltransferase DltB (MBOAT superfamily)
MVFNSFQFLVFFASVVPLYWLLPLKAQRWLLLVASYVFYMAWRAKYAILIAGISVLDYAVGLGIVWLSDRPRARRVLLVVSIVANLGILFTFKYWTFFGHSFEAVGGLIGHPFRWPVLDVVIPLGVSFHTFQSLSYTIDVYRGKIPAERSLVTFALFVAFFPQLVAGPIERGTHLLPQFQARRRFESENLVHGLKLIAIGLFKKMAVADNLASVVDQTYARGVHADPVTTLFATYAYAFQIYADFSGYSDIAIGVAKCMGFELVTNFGTPYFSRTPVEFWRRWHISLSSWLRDYLYIPLGGNRKGRLRTYLNLMTTMLLGGLWHGANWTFVVWGALNGLYLSASKALEGLSFGRRQRVPTWLAQAAGILVTFHLICLAWVYFRSFDVGQANAITLSVGGALLHGRLWSAEAAVVWGRQLILWRMQIGLVVGLLALDGWVGSGAVRERFWRLPMPLRYAAYSALVLTTLTFGVYRAAHFIYFQF